MSQSFCFMDLEAIVSGQRHGIAGEIKNLATMGIEIFIIAPKGSLSHEDELSCVDHFCRENYIARREVIVNDHDQNLKDRCDRAYHGHINWEASWIVTMPEAQPFVAQLEKSGATVVPYQSGVAFSRTIIRAARLCS